LAVGGAVSGRLAVGGAVSGRLAAGGAVSGRLAVGRVVGVYCNSSTVLAMGLGLQVYRREVLSTGRSSIGILARSLSIRVVVRCQRRVV